MGADMDGLGAGRRSGCFPHLSETKVVSWVKISVAQGNSEGDQERKDSRQAVSLPLPLGAPASGNMVEVWGRESWP